VAIIPVGAEPSLPVRYNSSVQIEVKTQSIVNDSKIRFGKPTIKGTRVAVTDILTLMEAGYELDEIPKQYKNVTLSQIKHAVDYARKASRKLTAD